MGVGRVWPYGAIQRMHWRSQMQPSACHGQCWVICSLISLIASSKVAVFPFHVSHWCLSAHFWIIFLSPWRIQFLILKRNVHWLPRFIPHCFSSLLGGDKFFYTEMGPSMFHNVSTAGCGQAWLTLFCRFEWAQWALPIRVSGELQSKVIRSLAIWS